MKIESALRHISEERHADYFGIADISSVRKFVQEQGGDELLNYPCAISIGIALFHDIVNQLPHRSARSVSVSYKHHCYDIINLRLDTLISEMSSYIRRAGFRVLPIPASKRVDDEKICGLFSHKMAASLSGLGWIGKSCLLITPDMGPRVRFATLLTDAPLIPTGVPMNDQCGNCDECVQVCPVQAFNGRPFHPQEARDQRYNARKCDQYFKHIRERDDSAVCGMCVYICPFGRVQNSQIR
jgi:epoxyqueuosine reductase